ncbi:MAG TPA: hypothetical protein VNW30_07340 [Opitutaceae bacterium]|jgi:hypothetical protein|nr:hypothetical protein [Opitutaceae bacterium]
MSTITLIVAIALCLNMLFVLFLIWRSREGYEDESGFHLGSACESSDTQTNDHSMAAHQDIFSPRSVTQ